MDDSSSKQTTAWRPIAEFPGDTPFKFLPEHRPEFDTRCYDDVLLYGVKWEGGWTATYPGDEGGKWGDEPTVEIGSTWSGRDFFTVRSSGPSDYDDYLKASHWMPLPVPPDLESTK